MDHDDQAGEWLYVEQAAARMGVSCRTMGRHVETDRVPHRRDERGRVLVFCPREPAAGTSPGDAGHTAPHALALSATATAAIAMARETADRHAEDLAGARRDARRARRSAWCGWSAVSAVAIAAATGSTWQAGRLREAQAVAAATAELAAVRLADVSRQLAAAEALAGQEAAKAARAAQDARQARAALETTQALGTQQTPTWRDFFGGGLARAGEGDQ